MPDSPHQIKLSHLGGMCSTERAFILAALFNNARAVCAPWMTESTASAQITPQQARGILARCNGEVKTFLGKVIEVDLRGDTLYLTQYNRYNPKIGTPQAVRGGVELSGEESVLQAREQYKAYEQRESIAQEAARAKEAGKPEWRKSIELKLDQVVGLVSGRIRMGNYFVKGGHTADGTSFKSDSRGR